MSYEVCALEALFTQYIYENIYVQSRGEKRAAAIAVTMTIVAVNCLLFEPTIAMVTHEKVNVRQAETTRTRLYQLQQGNSRITTLCRIYRFAFIYKRIQYIYIHAKTLLNLAR